MCAHCADVDSSEGRRECGERERIDSNFSGRREFSQSEFGLVWRADDLDRFARSSI